MNVVRDFDIIRRATIDAWPRQEIADDLGCSLAQVENVIREFYREARGQHLTAMQDRWTAWQMRMEDLYRRLKTQAEEMESMVGMDYAAWLDTLKLMTAVAVVSQKIDGQMITAHRGGSPWNSEDESTMSEQAVREMVKLHGLRLPQVALPQLSNPGGIIAPETAPASPPASAAGIN